MHGKQPMVVLGIGEIMGLLLLSSSSLPLMWALKDLASLITWLTLRSSNLEMISYSNSTLTSSSGGYYFLGQYACHHGSLQVLKYYCIAISTTMAHMSLYHTHLLFLTSNSSTIYHFFFQ
jgi:hypothetical protein